ncbi:MAG TPA: hypothetical protein VHI52_05555, partial [Verrucomicrobiae bacterium]|nr:hypothetical protein [Verrucomicrobiae bacterium]
METEGHGLEAPALLFQTFQTGVAKHGVSSRPVMAPALFYLPAVRLLGGVMRSPSLRFIALALFTFSLRSVAAD